jgi:two-component system, cell cycle sensor histidine kinase and response regulator CckA
VLLVEDDDAVRNLAVLVLQDLGYDVLAAASAEEAVTLARGTRGTRIRLLLTDVVMPGMSGRAVALTLQGVAPGIRTIFMSGYTDDEIVRDGVLDPEVVFLPKPFTPLALARKIREVLGA